MLQTNNLPGTQILSKNYLLQKDTDLELRVADLRGFPIRGE